MKIRQLAKKSRYVILVSFVLLIFFIVNNIQVASSAIGIILINPLSGAVDELSPVNLAWNIFIDPNTGAAVDSYEIYTCEGTGCSLSYQATMQGSNCDQANNWCVYSFNANLNSTYYWQITATPLTGVVLSPIWQFWTINLSQPDMAINTYTIPTAANEGDTVTFSAQVENIGGASGDTLLTFLVDGQIVHQTASFIVGPYQTSQPYSYDWTAVAGTYAVMIGANMAAGETNISNNSVLENINVAAAPQAPDLNPQEPFSWSPTNPNIYDDVTFSGKTCNIGTGNSDLSVTAADIDNDGVADGGIRVINSLASGACDEGPTGLGGLWNPPNQCQFSYDVWLKADISNLIVESNENNNSLGPKIITLSNLSPSALSLNNPSSPVDLAGVSLGWSGGDDPEQCSGTNYDVYLGASSPLGVGDKVGIVTTKAYNTGVLKCETTYYWKIVANDAQGNSTASSEESFTTSPCLPKRCNLDGTACSPPGASNSSCCSNYCTASGVCGQALPPLPGEGLKADLNCDGKINVKDFGIVLSWWGPFTPPYSHPNCVN